MLSDEEINAIWSSTKNYDTFARDIERAVLAKASHKDDLVQKIFDTSDRKAVDTFKHCPKCDHKCEAMPTPKQEPEPKNRHLVLCEHCFDDWSDEPEKMGQVKTNDCGEGCCYIFNDCKHCNGLGYKVVSPPQAAAIPESNNVWLDSLYQSAKALVIADENNTGNEPSVSVYYRAAEDFIQVSSDWPKFGHLSAAPKPEESK